MRGVPVMQQARDRELLLLRGAPNAKRDSAGTFLDVQSYKNLQRWTKAIAARPAVKRGRMVNRTSGDPAGQLRERHDASDFDTNTQDKVEAKS